MYNFKNNYLEFKEQVTLCQFFPSFFAWLFIGQASIKQITLFFLICWTGVTMVAVLVPILVSLLLDEKSIATANANRRTLSDVSLQKLLHQGQQYPEQFRQVMSMSVHLRPRLEAAVKLSQAAQAQAKARTMSKTVAPPKKPTITLTMDFSKNFNS